MLTSPMQASRQNQSQKCRAPLPGTLESCSPHGEGRADPFSLRCTVTSPVTGAPTSPLITGWLNLETLTTANLRSDLYADRASPARLPEASALSNNSVHRINGLFSRQRLRAGPQVRHSCWCMSAPRREWTLPFLGPMPPLGWVPGTLSGQRTASEDALSFGLCNRLWPLSTWTARPAGGTATCSGFLRAGQQGNPLSV